MKISIAVSSARTRTCMLVLMMLIASSAHAQKPISFLANVDPASDQTFFNIQVSGETMNPSTLNDLLRPGGGTVLRVTSIHALLFHSLTIPDDSHYALVFLGATNPRGGVRGFGAGTISASGGTTTQINFDPGLYVTLNTNESLTLRSQIQSNELVHVEVHGFLEDD